MTQDQLNELRKLRAASRHLQSAADEAIERLDQDIKAILSRCDHKDAKGNDSFIHIHCDEGGLRETTCFICDAPAVR